MSEKLRTESSFANPDDFYEAMISAHNGLNLKQSAMLNAQLILLLANHIGDLDVVREALALARHEAETVTPPEQEPSA
jgi:hypothetical protein